MKKENMNLDNIDARLDSPAQRQVSDVVRGLPDEVVSMAWRSALNEKLAPIAVQRQRSSRLSWLWKPTAGLAMAASLAALVMIQFSAGPTNSDSPQVRSVEASLVAFHRDSTVAYDIAGPGAANPEPTDERGLGRTNESNWTEDDLTSL